MREEIRPKINPAKHPQFSMGSRRPVFRKEFSRGSGKFQSIKNFFRKIADFWKILPFNRKIIFSAILLLIIAGIAFGIYKISNKAGKEKQVYEALVMVYDQKTSDPKEDARSSLKKGDVIVIFPEGHNWSETEKNSYLILKIKLTAEESQKLIEPKQKEVENPKKDENKDGMKQMPQMETLLARQYRLKVEKLDYNPAEIYKSQPYKDKVFDSGMMEKK